MLCEFQRFLKDHELAIGLTLVSLLYALAYLAYPAAPGGNFQYPLGWWGWFDQGRYLDSAKALSQLDFSAEKYFYPPLYPLLGSFFVTWIPNHPFWLIDLASLLWFVFVFIRLASLYVPKWVAVTLLTLTVLVSYRVLENFLIPWTSTVAAALLSSGIYGLIRLRDVMGADGNSEKHLPSTSVFGVSILIGLLAALRPLDSIVGGILWLGYMWKVRSISHAENALRPLRFGSLFSVAVAGVLVGPAIFLGFNYLVYGTALGSYIQVSYANGYFFADLFEKFVSIFLDGFTLYLEPNSALIDHYPWLVLALLGLCCVVVIGDWLLRLIALAICAQFALYLPYADLLPNGLWRYLNIHYFKWTFPYLALFGWLFGAFLIRQWTASRRKFFVLTGIASSAVILLLSLRLEIDVISAKLTNNAPSSCGKYTSLNSFKLSRNCLFHSRSIVENSGPAR